MPRKRKKNISDQSITILLVVDGSGSMKPIQDDVVGGINGFIEEQKKDGKDNTVLSLVVFDTRVVPVHNVVPINIVPPVTKQDTFLGGATALLDAVGITITQAQQRKLSGKKLLVIYTDGFENSSVEWTKDKIKDLLTEIQKEDWTVVFMAADVNAFAEARSMGVFAGNYVDVSKDSTVGNFTALSASATSYRIADTNRTQTFVHDTSLKDHIDAFTPDSTKKKKDKNLWTPDVL